MIRRHREGQAPPSAPVNEQFRATVTDVAFHLSLSRAMCCGLVGLALTLRDNHTRLPAPVGPWGRPFAAWASTGQALGRRGLIRHHYDDAHSSRSINRESWDDPEVCGIKWHYSLTPAGELVVLLLKEAGIFQEIESGLTWERMSA